jgi:hypothetical protein
MRKVTQDTTEAAGVLPKLVASHPEAAAKDAVHGKAGAGEAQAKGKRSKLGCNPRDTRLGEVIG